MSLGLIEDRTGRIGSTRVTLEAGGVGRLWPGGESGQTQDDPKECVECGSVCCPVKNGVVG